MSSSKMSQPVKTRSLSPASGTKSLIAGEWLSVRLPRRTVPIWVSEPMGVARRLRTASTPATNVVATAPMPGIMMPSFPFAGWIGPGTFVVSDFGRACFCRVAMCGRFLKGILSCKRTCMFSYRGAICNSAGPICGAWRSKGRNDPVNGADRRQRSKPDESAARELSRGHNEHEHDQSRQQHTCDQRKSSMQWMRMEVVFPGVLEMQDGHGNLRARRRQRIAAVVQIAALILDPCQT